MLFFNNLKGLTFSSVSDWVTKQVSFGKLLAMRKHINSFFILGCVVVSTAVVANAETLCITAKNVIVRRNASCKKSEKPATISNIAAAMNSLGLNSAVGIPGPQGETGAKGDTGAKGATGPQGISGVSGRQLVTVSDISTFNAGDVRPVFAVCPGLKVAIGGACSSSNSNIELVSSGLADGFGSIYSCVFKNTHNAPISSITTQATVACINAL